VQTNNHTTTSSDVQSKNQYIGVKPGYVSRVLMTTAIIMAVIGSLFSLYMIWEVILLFFVGFILAAAMRPTVLKLERRFKIPQAAAALILQVALFTFFAAFISLVMPPLVRESANLVNEATKTVQIPEFRWDFLMTQDLETLTRTFESFELLIGRFGQSLSSIFGIVNSVMTGIILTVTLFVVMYYFIVSYDHVARSFSWMLPGTKEEKIARATKILDNVSYQLGGWIRGRFIVMIMVGICTYIGLTLLGIPYALPLAIAATLLEIIPNIGPILAAIPAVLIALFLLGPVMALIVTVFYIVLQQVESSFFTPQVMKKAVDVHPLTTLFLIMIGLHLMGVKGGLLVLPIYVTLRSVVQEVFPHNGPLGTNEDVV
jgi:predicted PurR-regulated permease PerM